MTRHGATDLSEAAVNMIREEVKDSVSVIERDKYMSADPYLSYHKDALKYALNNVLIASLMASINDLTRK